jgi:two-component SAPR family response regulator
MLIMVCKVLLVDDEPHLLAGYKRILEDYCDPALATGAVDALLLLANHGPFNVLVTDYYMPYMNGVELLIEAYQLSPETEMVMLTGRGSLDIAAKAINEGMVSYYLDKPVPSETLLRTIAVATEKHRKKTTYKPLSKSDLTGLLLMMRGEKNAENQNLRRAVRDFKNARSIFKTTNSEELLARVNLHLAKAIYAYNIENKRFYDESLSKRLLLKGLAITKNSSTDIYTKPEWAALQQILNDNLSERSSLQDKTEIPFSKELSLKEKTQIVSVNVLGPLGIYLNGSRLKAGEAINHKALMLFLFLITYREKNVPKELIHETFWPNLNHIKAGNNLSSAIYAIRQVLGKEVILNRKGFCCLNRDLVDLDLRLYCNHLEMGNHYYAAGENHKALDYFSQALKLYRGDYLSEYLYEEWIEIERVQFKQHQKGLLEITAEIYAGQKLYKNAAEILSRLPLLDVYEDHLFFRLIDYNIKAGSKCKAKQLYGHYKELIQKELGIEPDPSIEALLL